MTGGEEDAQGGAQGQALPAAQVRRQGLGAIKLFPFPIFLSYLESHHLGPGRTFGAFSKPGCSRGQAPPSPRLDRVELRRAGFLIQGAAHFHRDAFLTPLPETGPG